MLRPGFRSELEEKEKLNFNDDLSKLKSYNISSYLIPNTFIDAMDTNNSWRVAKILKKSFDVIKITYYGWAHTWDEEHKINSNKLAPFRKYTPPYTGSSKFSSKNSDLTEYFLNCYQKIYRYMNDLTNNKFNVNDPHYYNQIIRGELYFLIDSILSSNHHFDDNVLKTIIDFFENFLMFSIKFFEIINFFMREYIEGKSINQMLYLTNGKIAVVSSLPEILDSLNKIFCGNNRCVLFYEKNHFELNTPNGGAPFTRLKDIDPILNQVHNFINYFGKNNGFEKIITIIKWERYRDNIKDKFPFLFLKMINIFFLNTIKYLSYSIKEKILKDFISIFLDKINDISLSEIKDLDIALIFSLIRDIQPLLEEGFIKEIDQILETNELNFSLKLLKCAFLERRLKGINELKDIVEKIDPSLEYKSREKSKTLKYYNESKFKIYILENEIIEFILGENFHVEIFKRAINLFIFLAKMDALSKFHIKLLWNLSEEKLQNNKKVHYESIIELSKYLSISSLEYLFSLITEIDIEKIDDHSINLIKEVSKCSLNVILKQESEKSNFNASKYFDCFGFKFFWNLIQDESKLSSNNIKACLSAFGDLFSEIYKVPKSEKDRYLIMCFDNVKKGISVPQSLLLSLHIFASFQNTAIYNRDISLSDIILKYNKDYNFFDLIISDFERLLGVNGSEKKIKKVESIENKLNSIIINDGKYCYNDHIETRLTFIENINTFLTKKFELNIDHIKKLWNILIKYSKTDAEKSIFFDFLNKGKESNYSMKKNYFLNENLMKNIFNNIINDKYTIDNNINISINVYNGIKTMFETVNVRDNNMEMPNQNSFKILKYDNLIGIKIFWNILTKCSNETVLKLCRNYLNSLHLQLIQNSDKLTYCQKFFKKSVDLITDTSINSLNITAIILLLKDFILNFDGKKFIDSQFNENKFIEVYVGKEDDLSNKLILNLKMNATFKYLRSLINDELQLNNQDFDITVAKTNFKVMPDREEELQISLLENYRDKERDIDIIISLNKNINPTSALKEKFITIIANDQKISDILFEKLSDQNNQIVEEIWKILKLLPINKNVRRKIEKISLENNEDNIIKLLDYSCLRKFLYCLEIINDIIFNSKEINEQWNIEFCKKKGFNHLHKMFMQIQEDYLKFSFNLKSFAMVAKIISFFLKKYNQLLNFDSNKTYIEIINKSLFLLKEGIIFYSQSKSSTFHIPIDFLSNLFDLIFSCLLVSPNLIQILYQYQDFIKIISFCILECEDNKIRTKVVDNLLVIIDYFYKNPIENIISPHIFFLDSVIFKLFENVGLDIYFDKCENFFIFFCTLIEKIFPLNENIMKNFNLNEIFNKLNNDLLKFNHYEHSEKKQNFLMQGYFKFFETVIRIDNKYFQILTQNTNFLNNIFESCLFQMPSVTDIVPPKCKNKNTRAMAFSLLKTMVTKSSNNSILEIIQKLKILISKAFWRTNNISDWNNSLSNEKSELGFVGLKNLGCTCYMNSVFQQFFMITNFREYILEMNDMEFFQKIDLEENLLYQFQLIMAGLKYSHKQYYDPRGFCKSFKANDGKPINVLEQMDADEFFNDFLDKLEKILKIKEKHLKIREIFGGSFSNELIGKSCPHSSEKEEDFHAIGLQVKNKRSIQDSLLNFVQGELLEGPNAYFCETCDKKVSALKRTSIKKLPNILILVLKRFEFDYDTMTKIKLNDFCEFPQKLDMLNYTQSYIKKKEKEQILSCLTETPTDEGDEIKFPLDYYQYNLTGIVIHSGTADSGHYYSIINDKRPEKDNKWIEFNDTYVRSFDIKNLPSEAYGGEEKISSLSSANINQSKLMIEKSRNAYLLFYERKYYGETEDVTATKSKRTSIFSKFFEEIKEDNERYYINKYLFDKTFSNFVANLLETLIDSKISNKNNFELCKFTLHYFFSVSTRAKDKENLGKIYKNLKEILRLSDEISNWFILQYSNEKIILETIVECPNKDIKTLFLGLITISVKKISELEKSLDFNSFKTKSNLAKLLISCLYVFYESESQRKTMDSLYKTFVILCRECKNCKLFLLKEKIFTRIWSYLSNSNTIETREFRIESNKSNEKGLGMPTIMIEEKNKIISFDEMSEKKKEKIYFEGLSNDYSNLIILFCEIGFSLKFGNFIPFFLNSTEWVTINLESQEEKIIINDIVWRKLMNDAKGPETRVSLMKFMKYLTFKKEKISYEVIKVVFEEINEANENDLNVYWNIIEGILDIVDELQNFRFLSKYFNFFLKKNTLFYKTVEISLDYIFKICSKNDLFFIEFSKYLNKNNEKFNFLEDWLKESINLSSNLSDKKYYKKKMNTYSYGISYSDQNKLNKKTELRLEKLYKIQKQEKEGLELEYNYPDEEIVLQENEKYEIIMENSNTINSIIIIENYNEILLIKDANSSSVKWIFKSQIKFGPYLKIQEDYDELIDFIR